ncbi:MAG TPA: hypothetical protein VMR76_03045 [Candidatus Saccharimonadia bacterium]|nr:hypothetical protein [Candidatus Saccharimonadia bacterium]
MTQFNLLPDSKLNGIKSRRMQYTIVVITILASVVVLFIVGLLLIETKVLQKHNINNYNTQITSGVTKLNKTSNLNAVLKINDAIKTLPSLYDSRPVASQLPSYLSKITPADVSITSINLDFGAHTIVISGSASSITAINTFADTLKFCQYINGTSSAEPLAFSDVVLSSFSFSSNSTSGQGYSITANFDPAIFDAKNTDLTLNVKNQITTRSEVNQPADLFQPKNTSAK